MNDLSWKALKNPVKTRFLILSDTHGEDFAEETRPLEHADVAIHCGDLSEKSDLRGLQTTIRLLEQIDAPLKLVIPGNHDFVLDETLIPWAPRKAVKARGDFGQDIGSYCQARYLFEEANQRHTGIVLLDEGTHAFQLQNGAQLAVYASPLTPSPKPKAFQYDAEQGHDFDIPETVDLVITHGPPRGVLDIGGRRVKSGCPDLFAAVARARPRLHCFGHVHRGWGASFVTWKGDRAGKWPSYYGDVDHDKSRVIESLATLAASEVDLEGEEERSTRINKAERYAEQRYCGTSHCSGDETPVCKGKHTLFVNAALRRHGYDRFKVPWLVDIELERAEASSEEVSRAPDGTPPHNQ